MNFDVRNITSENGITRSIRKTLMPDRTREDYYYDSLMTSPDSNHGTFCADTCHAVPAIMMNMLVDSRPGIMELQRRETAGRSCAGRYSIASRQTSRGPTKFCLTAQTLGRRTLLPLAARFRRLARDHERLPASGSGSRFMTQGALRLTLEICKTVSRLSLARLCYPYARQSIQQKFSTGSNAGLEGRSNSRQKVTKLRARPDCGTRVE